MRFGVYLGLSLFLLLGFFLFGVGARNVWRGVASSNWPVAAAMVVESGTSQRTDVDHGKRTSSTTYSANIVFRYEVNGRQYTTNLIQFGQTVGSGDSSDAELRRVRYPEGSAVSVRYHPTDHSIAAAQAGFHPDSLWLPGAGLGFLLPAVMFFLLYQGSEGGSSSMGYGLGLFSIIFMLIGMGMLTGGLLSVWRAYESQRWPSTTGVIIYGKQDSDRDSVRSTSHGMNLIYSYEVGGRKHYSNVRVFGQLAGADSDWAADIGERYAMGKEVRVAYFPGNPDLAVLEPGIKNEAYFLPGAGAAFLLFGLAAFFIGIPALSARG